MAAFLSKLVNSPLFKKIVTVVVPVIAAALLAWAATGCAGLLATHKALTVLDCRAAALAPYLGDRADDVVREIEGNQAFDVVRYLLRQGLDLNELEAVAEAYHACSPPEPAPVPEPREPGLQTLY
jgi:hypothetical protein